MPRKRAPNGSGVIRQRKDGRWEAIYSAGNDPGTGKLIRKSIYGKSEAEVAKALRSVTSAIDNGSYVEPEKLPMREWLKIWLEDYTSDIKPGTYTTYETQVRMHLTPLLGAIRLSELRAHDVQTCVNKLHRGRKGIKPLSSKSVKNVYGVLHRALEQAVKIGYLKANPADACILPRIEKKEIKPMDDEALNRFLDAVRGDPFEHLYVVDLFLGLRKGELLGLTWDAVDFDKGTIKLYRQLMLLNGAYSFAPLKNDKPRSLIPSKHVIDALREQRRIQIEHRMRAGKMWSNKEGFVFTDELGGHLKHQTVYKRYKRIVASIGIPESRFHDMRHSYAILALKNGDDPKTVQENLGHATASFTLDTYAHSTDQMKRESAQRMDAAIDALRNGK